ncbi:multidrug effflux MFS transporter [Facilibium subflavum]|uniref:multidrug effflux MFS transporter n=1 Tax=Facilibium subflavum TaxID=2219058 RepID=UPI0013C2A580|nr:multidrug effflux MFS transporter [Facilibium subflavum]
MKTNQTSLPIILILILILANLSQVVSDIYLPSLPFIAQAMKVSHSLVQLSLFSFMTGLAVAVLFSGLLSDAIGRKKPIIAGLIVCIIGSLICISSHSIVIFNIGRALQGFGAGVAMSPGRAIFRDIFDGKKLAIMGSYLTIANIGIMTAAPFLGGYLQQWFNWHASFIFITWYAIVTLVAVLWLLPETHQYKHRDHIKPAVIKANLLTLAYSAVFIKSAFCIFFVFAAVFAWLTAGPVILQVYYGLMPIEFGWFCVVIGIVFATGAFTNARRLKKTAPEIQLRHGTCITIVSGILLVIGALLPIHNALTIFIPILCFMFGASWVFPNTYAVAMTPFGEIAGIATALLVCLQMLGAVFSSALISLLPSHSALPMGIAMLGFCLIAYWLAKGLHSVDF